MGEVWHFDTGLSFIFLIHADNNCQPEAKYLIYQGTKPISQRIISHPGYPLLSGCQAGAKTLHLNSTRVTDSDSQKALLEYQAQQSLETMDMGEGSKKKQIGIKKKQIRIKKKQIRIKKKTNRDQKKTKCRKHEKTQGNNEEIQEQWRDQKKTKSQKGEKGEKGEQKERKKERN